MDVSTTRFLLVRHGQSEWNAKGRELTGKPEGHRELGFIAQEARGVHKQYVAANESAAIDGEEPLLTVKKDEMIADLVALVQAMNTRLRELEEKLA